jgi:hypothetical protein
MMHYTFLCKSNVIWITLLLLKNILYIMQAGNVKQITYLNCTMQYTLFHKSNAICNVIWIALLLLKNMYYIMQASNVKQIALP